MNSIENIHAAAINAAKNGNNDQSRLQKACQDFEALFISQMLKIMRDASGGESGGLSLGNSPFQGMFDWELSRTLSEKAPFGISDMMMRKLEKNLHDSDTEGDPSIKVDLESTELKEIIEKAATKHGLDPELIKAVINTESSARPELVSDKGAKGLMQLMDGTASELGVVDPFEPNQNIAGGTRYLRRLLDRYDNDIQMALAAYNAGPSKVDQYESIPPYPETQTYVRRVLEEYRRETGNKTIATEHAQSGEQNE